VPAGRVLLISNHSGQLPLDGVVIGAAMFMDAEPPRIVRAMVEKWTQTLPFVSLFFSRVGQVVGVPENARRLLEQAPRIVRAMVEKWTQTLPFVSLFFSRVGQVVGVPENARRLLEQGEALLVFPEGARGISKTFDHRYQLTDFGLGFMRLAMETNTPIVPIAVIGAEEQYVSVANLEKLARIVGAPALPVMPQLLLPGGILPLPTRYRVYFGEPMRFVGDHDDEDAVIEEKVWLVKATIQSMLNRGLKARKSIFW
jgi:1-acyl-sn-glycerol-3-phosphate acyltransferase